MYNSVALGTFTILCNHTPIHFQNFFILKLKVYLFVILSFIIHIYLVILQFFVSKLLKLTEFDATIKCVFCYVKEVPFRCT